MVGRTRRGRRFAGSSVSPNRIPQAVMAAARTIPTAYTHRHDIVRRIPSAISGTTTGPTRKTAVMVDITRAIRSPV